jgi:hypothetical protein
MKENVDLFYPLEGAIYRALFIFSGCPPGILLQRQHFTCVRQGLIGNFQTSQHARNLFYFAFPCQFHQSRFRTLFAGCLHYLQMLMAFARYLR